MKYYYKMLEATNKEEAIVSILDAVKHNAVWLNKCTTSFPHGYFFTTLIGLNEELRKKYLEELSNNIDYDNIIIDLFVKLKTEYYNFLDNTRWN